MCVAMPLHVQCPNVWGRQAWAGMVAGRQAGGKGRQCRQRVVQGVRAHACFYWREGGKGRSSSFERQPSRVQSLPKPPPPCHEHRIERSLQKFLHGAQQHVSLPHFITVRKSKKPPH